MDIPTKALLETTLQMKLKEFPNYIMYEREWENIKIVAQQHKTIQKPLNEWSIFVDELNSTNSVLVGHKFKINNIIRMIESLTALHTEVKVINPKEGI